MNLKKLQLLTFFRRVWKNDFFDRSRSEDLDERNEDEIEVLQDGGHLPQKCDVEPEREQRDAADVPNLEDPSSE